MVVDASPGLHKLCGFLRDGPILEIKVSSKIFHVCQTPLSLSGLKV
jgi:hypothetical protein